MGIFHIWALEQKSIIVRGLPEEYEAGLCGCSSAHGKWARWSGIRPTSETTTSSGFQEPVELDVLSAIGSDDDASKCLPVWVTS